MMQTHFNVHISGVTHLGLTDFALTSPILTRIFDGQKSTLPPEYALKTINKIGLAFFDKYLKSEGEFINSTLFAIMTCPQPDEIQSHSCIRPQ